MIVGGEDNDVLIGGLARDILTGGLGSDMLLGRSEEDILIGGRTTFDDNTAALLALQAEWTSNRTYADRIKNLSSVGTGFRLNGEYF